MLCPRAKTRLCAICPHRAERVDMKQTLLSLALAFACTASSVSAQEDCYVIPGRFNVERGDVVLSADPNGIIYKLLSSLGQRFSHSGLALSESSIRHNTADQKAFDTNDSFLI